ncbi:hypothetical protein HELRODRAFT_185793 [Helobdella robusta]|uniref:Probable D-lactate dehydrogenase, mitochondrial n=1 Tax=Helobdella robusta TaxID=6412 RepID=T1FNA6_HELRO|nr:hypothetical protein HELRODRAFT_185793 [Helobdella robusta]ESO00066.1 hypothetical protein HELRODRAFT_185793 [Helobdella robusta]
MFTKQLSTPLKLIKRCYNRVTPEIISSLKHQLGEGQISTSQSVREHHGKDESSIRITIPDVVVFPQTTKDVSMVLKLCNHNEIPVIPFGTGTGLAGGVSPLMSCVSMDLTKMDQIVDLHVEDFDVTVQPGVTRKQINNYLKDYGLMFPVDPGADASLCGMAATSASGTNAVKYGTMKSNVLNMEVVLADGTVIHTAGKGRRSRKSAAGYNLTNLFIGTEGTLGVITSATLKLYGIPEMKTSAVCQFKTVGGAIRSTIEVIQNGIDIARIEFLDEMSMRLCKRYSKLDYMSEEPTLFLEFQGSQKTIEDYIELTSQITKSNGGGEFMYTLKQEDTNQLWAARHNYFYAVLASSPNKKSYTTDVAVPISRLEQVVEEAREIINKSGFLGPIAGHVGDGNFHAILLFNPADAEEVQRCNHVAHEISKLALRHDGTCTGEHGIGLEKKLILPEEVGMESVDVMKKLKMALDPKGILNPGKLLA